VKTYASTFLMALAGLILHTGSASASEPDCHAALSYDQYGLYAYGWCDNGDPDWDFQILAMCDDHNGNPTGGFVSPIVPTTEVATAYCQWGYISGAVVWDVIPPEDGGGDEGGDDGGGPGDCPLCPPCPGCPIP